MTENTIRVLIVDDEPLILAGLRSILDAAPEIEVVAEASDGAEALRRVAFESPDVVLMGVRMPVIDGIEATRRLVERGSSVRILIVTTFERDDYVFDALRAGANGFMLKRARPDEILDAVRTIVRGDSLVFPAALRRLVGAQRPASAPDRLRGLDLTGREKDVLRLVARGLSNAEIAGELFLGVETVKTHVTKILTKLGARDRTQAVIAAYESGFLDR